MQTLAIIQNVTEGGLVIKTPLEVRRKVPPHQTACRAGGVFAAPNQLHWRDLDASAIPEGHFTLERFAKVCTAARWNVRTPLDLIFIHAEEERGRQPHASLT